MNEVILSNNNLPSNIEDLSKFALIGREKLAAVRAEIRAIDKVGMAKEVREQKLAEAQQIADVVLDAEVKIGELMLKVPKASGGNHGNQYTGGKIDSGVEFGNDETKKKADEIIAAGITQKQAERFQTLAKHPEVVAKAKEQAKKDDDIVSRSLVLNMIKQEQKETKKQEVQTRIENYAKVQTGIVDIYHTNKKYNIIYADPPWRYWEGGDKNQSKHYLTMPIEDICKIPVSNIADENCVLFLWVTYPILPDVFRVIESWGFDYSTCGFCWVKRNKQADSPFFGCGAWTRANSELCLIATKGSVMRLDATISQVIESPIEEHSKKPDIVRELITKLVGELPRIELFSRQQVAGWDVWGNEA